MVFDEMESRCASVARHGLEGEVPSVTEDSEESRARKDVRVDEANRQWFKDQEREAKLLV